MRTLLDTAKKNVFEQVRLVPANGSALKQLIPLGLSLNVLISALLMLLPEAWLSSYQDASGMVVGGLNIVTLLLVVVLGPIAEEVLFRGLIYTRFSRALPRFAAALCASVLFGLMHGNLVWMIYTAALGVALCMAMEHVHSLWGAIVLHMSFNAGSLIMMLFGGVSPLLLLAVAAVASCVFFIRIKKRGPIQPGAGS